MRRRPGKEEEEEEEDYDMFAAYPFLAQSRPSGMSFLPKDRKGEREKETAESAVGEAKRPRRRKRKSGRVGRRPGLRRLPPSSLPWVVRWCLTLLYNLLKHNQ